jgi:hypothetical protein
MIIQGNDCLSDNPLDKSILSLASFQTYKNGTEEATFTGGLA